jgi:hypothetical protein
VEETDEESLALFTATESAKAAVKKAAAHPQRAVTA